MSAAENLRSPVRMKVRPEPRITAPKLGDYMASLSAAARQRILRDQKITPDFQTARYRRAVGDVRVALVTSGDCFAHLTKAAARLRATKGATDWQVTDNAVSAEAVEKFAKFFEKFDRKGLTFAPTRTAGYKMPIEGVAVSVYPIARIAKANRDGTHCSGALLTVFRKGDTLSDRAGEVAAQLVRMALMAAGDKDVAPNLCIVIDVFRSKAFRAPKRSTKLQGDIAAACQEIATVWPAIKEKLSSAEKAVTGLVIADLPLRAPSSSEDPMTFR